MLQCSVGLSNKVSNIIRRLMNNMKLLLICILGVLLSQYFFINVYMVLFLFNNVIYVFLLFTACLSMTTLTEGFPCFYLSCKANARVKPAKTGHDPDSSKLLCCSMYFLCCSMYFCVVLCIVFCGVSCIVCVCMCTEQLPPGGYPIAVKYIILYVVL